MPGTAVHFSSFALILLSAAFGLHAAAGDPEPSANGQVCKECLKIRVGLPRVARIPDSAFTEIRLLNGQFRGFTASTSAYAIDGATPTDMGRTPRLVLGKAAPGQVWREWKVD